MAKVESKFLRIAHPITARAQLLLADVDAMYVAQGFIRQADDPATEVEGPIQHVEYRKTLDYNRDERRAAKKSGQELKHNEFKSIIPTGWRVLAPEDDDPTE